MRRRLVGVERFQAAVPQATLDDLAERLARVMAYNFRRGNRDQPFLLPSDHSAQARSVLV
jgi:hypothetical protein